MEVKPGYKQTEVGVIPEDWDVKTIDQVGQVLSGKRLPLGRSLTEKETSHPYIRVADMEAGKVSLADIKFVPDDVFPCIRSFRIFVDDIFISVAGSIGIVGKIPTELDGANLTENANRITNISCFRDFLLYVLMSPLIQNVINSVQTVGAQPKLALTRIRKFSIALPSSVVEQTAIATALSDVDALIDSLEQLIKKKRQIKQGAMQELLTGKRRLPGFGAQWLMRSLDEIATFHNNLRVPVKESKREIGSTPYYGANGIQGYIKGYTHNGEFVLIAEDGANDLLDYPVSYVTGRVWVNNHAHVIQGVEDRVTTKYLSYAMKTIDFTQVLVGGTRAKLNGSAAKTLRVSAPKDIAEQTAIATVLSDMDSEIEALEAKLSKTRQLKQGMMQVLLTGRIRLV